MATRGSGSIICSDLQSYGGLSRGFTARLQTRDGGKYPQRRRFEDRTADRLENEVRGMYGCRGFCRELLGDKAIWV